MRTSILRNLSRVIFSAVLLLSMIGAASAARDEERDFVVVLTGIDSRVESTRPYYVEFQNGFVRRFHPQEQHILNEPGIFYSYKYPQIYPFVPQESRSRTTYTRSVKVTEFVHDISDRDLSYVYDPGYFEKGYSRVSRALPLNGIPHEDRAFSRPSRRIYDNGPRLDIE